MTQHTLSGFKIVLRREKKKLRYIDLQAKYGDVNVNYYWNMINAKGYVPPDPVALVWNLPTRKAFVRVLNGSLPKGALVIVEMIKQCPDCGNWFISNAGKRILCYVCSPYQGKRVN